MMNLFPERKAIMIGGHTIAVIFPNGLQILHASLLYGSPYPNMALLAPLLPTDTDWRYATEQDFDDFGLTWHPSYDILTP